MVRCALYVALHARPGKEAELAKFLKDGLAVANDEPATPIWFALQLGPSSFAIFDAFADDSGRQAHLQGRLAAALMEKAPELLAKPPNIERADVLAVKGA